LLTLGWIQMSMNLVNSKRPKFICPSVDRELHDVQSLLSCETILHLNYDFLSSTGFTIDNSLR